MFSIRHMCIDISGVLRWPDKDLKHLFTEDGRERSGKYVRDWLKLQLAQGKRVLPMCKCEGFSYQDGCPGHASSVQSGNEVLNAAGVESLNPVSSGATKGESKECKAVTAEEFYSSL